MRQPGAAADRAEVVQPVRRVVGRLAAAEHGLSVPRPRHRSPSYFLIEFTAAIAGPPARSGRGTARSMMDASVHKA
jgi:hypothetical protein